ncbi:MAG: type VI secretion system tip protein VgrG, partial [Syntrophobacteraceae bacterium]|nr:type VI secretion system tip protein VgrG [Syntrophobacteraceae bacterium]
MPLTQDNRLMAIDTPLGRDVLLLTGFRGTEAISSPYSFELSLISESHDISFESIIGKNVTVSLVLADGQQRVFNGLVSRFCQGRGGGEEGSDPRFSHYAATMVPWVWLLRHMADVRIFQELNAPDIIEKIFRESGFNDFRIKLSGSYEKRDYCVQFRETHFNFVSRLMEEEGIFYYFEHERGKHTLILADSPPEHKNCPHQESARYQISAGMPLEEDVIQGLVKAQEVKPAKMTLNDYNYSMPNTDLRSSVSSRQVQGQGEREVYDFPGLYPNKGRGERLTTVRMEEEEARITTIEGSSNCRAFTTGYRFTLKDHYRNDWNNRAYVLTEIEHEGSQGGNFPGARGEGGFSYSNRFRCIPIDVPFRPESRATKPVVHGTQTAVVVGPAGEEIHTDELGRIKVQFHWDREGKKDENSSCWIRVGQLWAGAQWGAVFIPRIGQEVIVAFLEGNPDRPLVIGCVYHQSNQPPLDLPGEKTRSTVKSDSTIGGGGFNEIRFEDKKGKEEIYIHAKRNQTIQVGGDENHTVN